jgi:hypothetical protein
VKEFGCANLSSQFVDRSDGTFMIHDTALKALIAERLMDIEPEDEAYTKMSL